MPVSFEKDIRPLFRPVDVDHMNTYEVFLDNYTYMSDPSNNHGHAQAVEDTLTDRSMPPGGPYWSDEQLLLYKKWRSDGYLP
jgi:FtsP/CotA-like multicopper oxidase with cupredoxin domain